MKVVCALRLGRVQQAVDLLRPVLLPGGARIPTETTPDAWIVTYATALALDGDLRGAHAALRWVKVPGFPGKERLRRALEAWRKSLTWTEAARYSLGGPAPRPFTVDFPPGEL